MHVSKEHKLRDYKHRLREEREQDHLMEGLAANMIDAPKESPAPTQAQAAPVGLLFDYKTDEEKEAIIRTISGKVLTNSTYVQDVYKAKFKRVLMGRDAVILNLPIRLPIFGNSSHDGIVDSYMPQFLFPFNYIEGRSVVIEPQLSETVDKNFLKKLNEIRQTYPLYMILATTSDIRFKEVHENIAGKVDQLWRIDNDPKGMSIMDAWTRILVKDSLKSTHSVVGDIVGMLRLDSV
jgi:hypothetical protein